MKAGVLVENEWKNVGIETNGKKLGSQTKRYKNLTAVPETAKTSLVDDEFDASLDTLTQIWPNKLDMKVVGSVEKRPIGSNVTNKEPSLKTQRLPPVDTLKVLSKWQ